MEEKKKPADYMIPYFVHEDDMNKIDQSHRRVEKWLVYIIIMIFAALVASNIAWLTYESSFADEVTVTQETPNGNNNYIGRDGDITNGEADNN